MALDSPPPLKLRTLRLSNSLPGLEYRYEICVKKVIGICFKHAWTTDFYDLTKPEVRQQLIDMGFVARVNEEPVK